MGTSIMDGSIIFEVLNVMFEVLNVMFACAPLPMWPLRIVTMFATGRRVFEAITIKIDQNCEHVLYL